jgi:hypothetical protein
MTNYSQRYASADSNTAGAFYFDTISSVDYPASKVLWGAEGAVNHCSVANPLPVTAVNSGTFAVQAAQSGAWNITNISGTVSLPTGAATAAKQPALGTAGTASADVITIQGIASMTAVKVDGSAVTQPVSIASAVPVTDNSGSLTVDAPVGTPVFVRLSDGTSAISTLPVSIASSVTVVGTGTFAVQATVAASATNIAKAEDAASADADVGVPAMAVRKATPANTSGTDGDYEMLQMSAGRLWVDASGVSLTVGSHAVTNAGTFAVQVDGTALTRLTDIEANTDSCAVVGNGAAATAQRVTIANDSTGILAGVTTVTTCSTVTTLTGSGVAHDAADSGNPHKIGAKATTALSGVTLVADADRTDARSAVDGALLVRDICLEDVVQERTTNTDGASTAFTGGLAAPGAGIRLWITKVTIANSSASFCTVDLRDGAAGSVLWTLPVPATGGVVERFDPPLKLTANTALAFDASAATTTLSISANGFKSKI